MADDVQNVTTEQNVDNSSTLEQKTGWLLKRTKTSRKWRKKWFILKEKTLYYGDNENDETLKTIDLTACEITSCENTGKSNMFFLRPKDTGRKHYICANNETELQEWMQAICIAKAEGQEHGEGTQACVIQ